VGSLGGGVGSLGGAGGSVAPNAARLGVAWDNHEEERSRDACGEVAGMGEGWIGCNLGRIEVLLSGGTLGFL
jgi:hypothetical protein